MKILQNFVAFSEYINFNTFPGFPSLGDQNQINGPLVGIIENIFISVRAYCPNIYTVPRQVESFVIT